MSTSDESRAGGVLADMPTAFRVSQLEALGVSRSRLRQWVSAGLVERVGRGAYVRADAPMMDLDRLEMALRAPRATICLTSGLVEHDLVDDNPGILDLALPRGEWHPRTASPVRWHSFAASTFDLDRGVVSLASGRDAEARSEDAVGEERGSDPDADSPVLGLYGARRCIIDAFRFSHEVGPEIGVEALRNWLRRPSSNASALLDLARKFPHALPALTAALRVLL